MTSSRFPLDVQNLKPRSELIADAIRTSILSGHFRPGDKLDQQEIADELAVSHIPVREALRTLFAEGMITIIPNKGAIVTERTLEEVSELYFIRSLLEGAAAERAVEQIDDSHIEKMESILNVADQTNELERLLALNNDFHMTLYRAGSQPEMVELIQRLRNKVAPYNRMYMDVDLARNKAAAWDEHRRIYEACRAKDPQLAKAETEKHLDRVLQCIVLEMENLNGST